MPSLIEGFDVLTAVWPARGPAVGTSPERGDVEGVAAAEDALDPVRRSHASPERGARKPVRLRLFQPGAPERPAMKEGGNRR